MPEAENPDNERRSGVTIPMQDYVEALVEPVTSRIRAGDVTLREHLERVILEHKQSIETFMREADRLERARLAALEATVDERWARIQEQIISVGSVTSEAINQLRRERELVTAAQTLAVEKAQEAITLAIDKAEAATDKRFASLNASNDKRFEAVNEFRAQQADLLSRFLPREVAEAQFSEQRRAIAELTEKLSKIS